MLAGQKAPSAKRCIKTTVSRLGGEGSLGQKAPSAKRCIKAVIAEVAAFIVFDSQKAPSAKRCIKTVPNLPMSR